MLSNLDGVLPGITKAENDLRRNMSSNIRRFEELVKAKNIFKTVMKQMLCEEGILEVGVTSQ